MFRRRAAEIATEFLEDIAQRARQFDARQNGKRQAVRLANVVIRVLTEYDDAHLLERRQLKRCEDPLFIGEDLMLGTFDFEKLLEVVEVEFGQLVADDRGP